MTVTLLPGAWLSAVGYLCAAIVSTRFPEWCNETSAGGNETIAGGNVVLLLREQLAPRA